MNGSSSSSSHHQQQHSSSPHIVHIGGTSGSAVTRNGGGVPQQSSTQHWASGRLWKSNATTTTTTTSYYNKNKIHHHADRSTSRSLSPSSLLFKRCYHHKGLFSVAVALGFVLASTMENILQFWNTTSHIQTTMTSITKSLRQQIVGGIAMVDRNILGGEDEKLLQPHASESSSINDVKVVSWEGLDEMGKFAQTYFGDSNMFCDRIDAERYDTTTNAQWRKSPKVEEEDGDGSTTPDTDSSSSISANDTDSSTTTTTPVVDVDESIPPPLLPLHPHLHMNISFDCNELFQIGGYGTGNYISFIYGLRLAALLYPNVALEITCPDAQSHQQSLILPWLIGYFPPRTWQDMKPTTTSMSSAAMSLFSSATTATNTIIKNPEGQLVDAPPHRDTKTYATLYPNLTVPDVCGPYSKSKISYMYRDIQHDLRRMAIGLVGIPFDTHPSAQFVQQYLQPQSQQQQASQSSRPQRLLSSRSTETTTNLRSQQEPPTTSKALSSPWNAWFGSTSSTGTTTTTTSSNSSPSSDHQEQQEQQQQQERRLNDATTSESSLLSSPSDQHYDDKNVDDDVNKEKLWESNAMMQLAVDLDHPVFPPGSVNLDDVVIHFRCGDLMDSDHPNFAFVKFHSYIQHISSEAQSIGILTQPFRQKKVKKKHSNIKDTVAGQARYFDVTETVQDRCRTVVLALVADIQKRHPKSRITVHNGPEETIALAYARMIMANQTIAAISTFGVFPVVSTFGTGYLHRPNGPFPNNWMMEPRIDQFISNVHLIEDDVQDYLMVKDIKYLWEEYGRSGVLAWFRNETYVMPMYERMRRRFFGKEGLSRSTMKRIRVVVVVTVVTLLLFLLVLYMQRQRRRGGDSYYERWFRLRRGKHQSQKSTNTTPQHRRRRHHDL